MKKIKGFTLAEVLITLSILGVVAAIIIPNVVHIQEDRINLVKLKKFYSELDNVIELNKIKNAGSVNNYEIVSSLNPIKICYNPDISCATKEYKMYDGNRLYYWGKFDNQRSINTYAILKYGAIVRHEINNSDNASSCSYNYGTSEALKNVCSSIMIDLNGNKGPNTLGKDVFSFAVTKYGAIPYGNSYFKNNSTSSSSSCKTNGYGCATWFLEQGSTNYK